MIKYSQFIDELKVLGNDAKELIDAPMRHHDSKFRKWRHRVTDLIYQLENMGYNINCNIRDKLFDVYESGYGEEPRNKERLDQYNLDLSDTINELDTIIHNYENFGDPVKDNELPSKVNGIGNLNNVFIVHGHDEIAKVNVARFIEKLGLTPIILHEQLDKNQTIIEKFETNALSAAFAVVLFTPDDIGASQADRENLKARARQNVLLELGYFWGTLGRSKVCVLYKEEVDIPSDYDGVIYTVLDNNNGWQLKLAKEIKSAGLIVDLNSL